MKQPHKHAELIKAWADDPSLEIEFQKFNGSWESVDDSPRWLEDTNYRIKPEPKPDIVRDVFMDIGRCYWRPEMANRDPNTENLRLTFSGETGELIKAEVLK